MRLWRVAALLGAMTALFSDPPTLELPVSPLTVAVLGLGYVGLPTSLALREAGFPVIGVDISQRRLDAIREGDVDMLDRDRPRLDAALASGHLHLTAEAAALEAADAVIIAVPTPVDEDLVPDLRAVRAACASAVEHARPGQVLILTSTTYVGTTRELLVEPLTERGFTVGEDINVAFAPERINPGDALWEQAAVPRVLGGVTAACTAAASRVLAPTASDLYRVSSAEAAEFTKLQENTFRAVNLAFANEMAAAAGHYGIDPVEVVGAAASKPYGYLAHYPGPGVGGHCIPVDPYYLLTPLREAGVATPVTEQAMAAVAGRPAQVADRAIELAGAGAHPARRRRLQARRRRPPRVAGAPDRRPARRARRRRLLPRPAGPGRRGAGERRRPGRARLRPRRRRRRAPGPLLRVPGRRRERARRHLPDPGRPRPARDLMLTSGSTLERPALPELPEGILELRGQTADDLLRELAAEPVAPVMPKRRRTTVVDRVARVLAVGYLVGLLVAVVVYKGAFLDALTVSPLLAAYGLIVAGYIVSRFTLSLFYRPAKDAGLEPRVAIVMPGFNEEEAIANSLRSLLALDYPEAKLEIVAVNDGSTDDTLRQMRNVQREARGRVHVIDLVENQGKRAAMAAGIRATSAEIIAFVDSDSVVEPDALRILVQGFADRSVGAICGHADVLNVEESWLTKMQAVRYFVAFKVVKAAESIFSAVTCCSGCFSAYRREAILPHLDWWENQTFLGKPSTFGDDRSLTNCVLRKWKVRYEARAVSHTIVPAELKQFMTQQLRWKRSWTRESLIVVALHLAQEPDRGAEHLRQRAAHAASRRSSPSAPRC